VFACHVLSPLPLHQSAGCRIGAAFSSVLTTLKKLGHIEVDGWSTAMLPVLAQCTQLACIGGEWVTDAAAGSGRQSPASAVSTECRSVVSVGVSGSFPTAAFKQVVNLTHWQSWQPAAFHSIAQHCQQLQALSISARDVPRTASMPAAAPAEQRIAAIRSLAALQQLQILGFAANSSAEVVALTAITQLQQLDLLVPIGSSCTSIGLLHLVALRRLQQVRLVLYGMAVTIREAKSLIVALQFVPKVEICCTKGSSQWNAFETARARLRNSGMRMPEQLRLFGA
jgi:hypothetical protein